MRCRAPPLSSFQTGVEKEAFAALKVTTEQLEHRRLGLTIEVEEQRVQEALRATARQISRVKPIPGFRPGRAPVAVMMRRLGKEAVYDALVDEIGETLYEEAIEQLGIKPAGRAQLEDVQLEPLVLKVTIPLEPVVELGDYQALRLDPPAVTISDQEVEDNLLSLREKNVRWEPVSRPAQLGDRVTVALEGTNPEGEVLINEERASFRLSLDAPLPSLHEQLVQMVSDEEREFDLTYPRDSASLNLAGQTLHFRARLLEVREQILPTLDDEWAKTVGDYDSLDDLRVSVRARLEEEAGNEAHREYARQVLASVVDQAQIDYPQELVEGTLERMLFEQDMALQRQGLNLDLALRMQGKTRDQLRDEQREEAEQRLRRSLILGRVAELEELEVTPMEVTSYIRVLSSGYGDRAEQARRTMLASESIQDWVRQDLLAQKATARLVSIAKGEVEVAEAVEEDVQPRAKAERPEAVEAPEAKEESGEVREEQAGEGSPTSEE